MSTSSVEICNMALVKVGAELISSLSDNNKRAILCNLLYDKRRKRLIEGHPWRFARRRKVLERPLISVLNANISIANDTLTITQSGVFSLGDKIELLTDGSIGGNPVISGYPEGTDGSYGEFYVRPSSLTAIKLYATEEEAVYDVDLENAIDITSAGVNNLRIKYLNKKSTELSQVFAKPSDMLRPIYDEDKTINWVEENGFILTNETSLLMKYIADVTDTTQFSANFDEALAVDLAVQLAFPLVQSTSLKESLERELRITLADARSFSAQAGNPEELEVSEWLNSRL